MDSVVREDDLLVVIVNTHYPEWLDELDEEEFENVMASAKSKAISALAGEIYKAEQYWRARKMQSAIDQMDIYDYV